MITLGASTMNTLQIALRTWSKAANVVTGDLAQYVDWALYDRDFMPLLVHVALILIAAFAMGELIKPLADDVEKVVALVLMLVIVRGAGSFTKAIINRFGL